MKQVFLYGSSGHAKVIIDIIEGAGLFRIVGLIDDDPALAGVSLMGYPILGPGSRLSELVSFDMDVIVSIGHNATRRAIAERLTAVGYRLATAVHVRATVSRDVEIGPGSVVMAGAIINAGSRLGPLTILNTGAQIDHDCHIGTACHMAPASCLCGTVRIGDETFIGAGSVVIQNRTIGDRVVVGAGATVVNDFPSDVTVVGTPARPLAKRP